MSHCIGLAMAPQLALLSDGMENWESDFESVIEFSSLVIEFLWLVRVLVWQ
jgi:hypothetical protein